MVKNNEGIRENNEVWNNFRMLVRKKALKVILDKKNYVNSPKCPICNEIAEMTFFISFRLYRKTERTQFITLHSKCAFKKPCFLFKTKFLNKLDEIVQAFDYIVEV